MKILKNELLNFLNASMQDIVYVHSTNSSEELRSLIGYVYHFHFYSYLVSCLVNLVHFFLFSFLE